MCTCTIDDIPDPSMYEPIWEALKSSLDLSRIILTSCMSDEIPCTAQPPISPLSLLPAAAVAAVAAVAAAAAVAVVAVVAAAVVAAAAAAAAVVAVVAVAAVPPGRV